MVEKSSAYCMAECLLAVGVVCKGELDVVPSFALPCLCKDGERRWCVSISGIRCNFVRDRVDADKAEQVCFGEGGEQSIDIILELSDEMSIMRELGEADRQQLQVAGEKW